MKEITLLQRFKELIADHGGHERLVDAIEAEWTKTTRYHILAPIKKVSYYHWTKEDETFLIEFRGKKRLRSIARMLNRSDQAVHEKLRRMRKEGKIKSKQYERINRKNRQGI